MEPKYYIQVLSLIENRINFLIESLVNYQIDKKDFLNEIHSLFKIKDNFEWFAKQAEEANNG
jgi:hypothetical protein